MPVRKDVVPRCDGACAVTHVLSPLMRDACPQERPAPSSQGPLRRSPHTSSEYCMCVDFDRIIRFTAFYWFAFDSCSCTELAWSPPTVLSRYSRHQNVNCGYSNWSASRTSC